MWSDSIIEEVPMGPRLQPMLLTRSVLMQGLSFLTMKIDFLKALSSYRLGLKKES
jgi:hypothetical protein